MQISTFLLILFFNFPEATESNHKAKYQTPLNTSCLNTDLAALRFIYFKPNQYKEENPAQSVWVILGDSSGKAKKRIQERLPLKSEAGAVRIPVPTGRFIRPSDPVGTKSSWKGRVGLIDPSQILFLHLSTWISRGMPSEKEKLNCNYNVKPRSNKLNLQFPLLQSSFQSQSPFYYVILLSSSITET